MSLFDTIQNAAMRVLPEKKPSLPTQPSGIGSGGMVPFEDDLGLRKVHVSCDTPSTPSMVTAAETAEQTTQTGGFLVFLLFIPLLSTIWIWMIVSKPAIVFHVSQVFFNFLAMCTMAGAAAFQQKWHVGPSGLSGFAIFISVAGIFYSLFILLVPVIYEKYDKGARLARALKEVRVGFILSGAGTTVSLLIAFIVTISAWTEPGCKDASKDPHASLGKDFQKGLDGFCSTKKAAAIFFWLVFVFWCCSLTLTIMDWRNGKSSRPRDPPFIHPVEQSEGSVYERAENRDEDEGSDEEAGHRPYSDNSNTAYSPFSDANRLSGVPTNTSSNNLSYQSPSAPAFASSQPASRPSIDAYGAFSDPAPSGFAASNPYDDKPRVSRTMQYADPYAAVRASIAGGAPGATTPPAGGPPPPGYASYGEYR